MSDEHAALYAAEADAFEGTDLETPRPFDELHDVARQVVEGRWWTGPDVAVVRTRRDARSSSARCATSPTGSALDRRQVEIRLAPPQLTMATLAHELAHALAGPEHGHDAVYRAAYLDVVAVATNLDPTRRRRELHVDQLRSAFAAHGLGVGPRHWPEPPPGSAGAIPL